MSVLSKHPLNSLKINSRLIQTCEDKLQVKTYSHVQYAAIPEILQEKDCLVKAQTGSGKTLAYLLPTITMILNKHPKLKRTDGLFCLILTPTRELTQQVYDVLTILTTSIIGLVPSIVVGGDSKKSEKARIRKGVNILVGTPGRLLDHINSTNNLKLDKVEFLIMDEADRVLDAGFEKDVIEIINHVNKNRTSILVSATLTESVKKLSNLALKNPVFIDGDKRENAKERKKLKLIKENGNSQEKTEKLINEEKIEDKLILPSTLKQYAMLITDKYRLAYLIACLRTFLKESIQRKIIVFFSCIQSVNYHYSLFSQLQFMDKTPILPETSLFRLHGDLTTVERHDGMQKFIKSKKAVLFTTDVAARGIDLKDIDWIIQYDPPGETSEYIHRVGRTARIGRNGNALLMLLESEGEYVNLLRNEGVIIEEMKRDEVVKSLNMAGGDKKVISRLHEMQLQVEKLLIDNEELKEMAIKSFQAHLRSYTTHRGELRKIFSIKKLHIGHICKSFGIRDTPTSVMSVIKKQDGFLTKPKEKKKEPKEGMRKMSEFDAGIITKKKKKK
ncbi:ATP-dependent RNA helicase DBP7, putative [Entamoeba dispar SAW760]|uniref:ATP-dependent RNA helicase n=1 Tax=Entamoeba dispar (strain ATCC PRA-260 / SAW760) TaxID=370354 RepID=B0ENJ0_ENTDS|nr:ATP-dependent RNA helicase DBP7, putative [Entamoeba dispar SAW760]EDR23910.1 ATP-dependent RNA helicase DBP7, putative [Entamoeba dispar SAW760]|eukprot:EDR23910.1 ATP-dependent RNA helicase DBP7, putative [Entamoeba dispar SAW760]